AEEREAVVGRRREDAYDTALRFGDETSLGRQGEEPDEVGAGVTPVLQVRQGDRGADVVLVEPSDPRSFHIFTRRSSSSTSSHSCRSTYRTSPGWICRPIVIPSTEIATSWP